VEHKDIVTNLSQWPTDKRINPENWKNVLAPEWSKKGRKADDQRRQHLCEESPKTIIKPEHSEIGNAPSTQKPPYYPQTPVTNPCKRSRDSDEDNFGSVKKEKLSHPTGLLTPNSPSPDMFTNGEFINLNAKSRESPTTAREPKKVILCGTGFGPASGQKFRILHGVRTSGSGEIGPY
jgi:hypothetical protein